MPTCKLCHNDRDLCNSHIVPEFIYTPLYDPDGKMVGVFADAEGVKSHLVQKGLREPLLCSDCEQYINRNLEQPQVELWKRMAAYSAAAETEWNRITTPQGSEAVLVEGVDYSSFKLFLLSILWRASVSTRPEFAEVQLGPHEETIREMILRGEAGLPHCYPCIVFKLDGPAFMLPPVRQRIDGRNVYDFTLTTIRIWFIVGSHIAGDPIVSVALRENGTLTMMRVDPRETVLWPELQSVERATKHSPSVTRRLGLKH